MRGIVMRNRWTAPVACLAAAVVVACSGASDEPIPAASGFQMFSGQTVLVLPVQYVRQVPGGWVGGAANSRDAARLTDTEIAFALQEQAGRASWVTPEMQVLTLRRRPGIDVDPYSLAAGEIREKGGNLKDVKDPLYGEIRTLAALFDTRYVLWPLEVYYRTEEEDTTGHLAVRTFVLDARRGDVLWYGTVVEDGDQSPTSSGALAALAQKFAVFVSP